MQFFWRDPVPLCRLGSLKSSLRAQLNRVHDSTNSYIPCPAFLSFPCLTSSSQTTAPNWLGGTMATMGEDPPLVVGRRVIFESSSSWVNLRRFLKALNASFKSFWVGGVGSVIDVSSRGRRRINQRDSEKTDYTPSRQIAIILN